MQTVPMAPPPSRTRSAGAGRGSSNLRQVERTGRNHGSYPSAEDGCVAPLQHLLQLIVRRGFPRWPARQTDTQTGRQKGRQLDREAERQNVRQTGTQTGRQKGKQTVRQTDRQTDRQTGRNRQTKRQRGRETDGRTNSDI